MSYKSILSFLLIFLFVFACVGGEMVSAQRNTIIKTEILPWLVLHPNVMLERTLGSSLSVSLGGNVSGYGVGLGAAAYYYFATAPRGLHFGPSFGYFAGGGTAIGLDGGYQWITKRGLVFRLGLTASWTGGSMGAAPLVGVGLAF